MLQVKQIYIKVLSLVLAAVVLVSSAGLSLNVHHCHTSGTERLSLLPFPQSCHHHDDIACGLDEAADSLETCCVAAATAAPKQQKIEKTECCEDIFHYLKTLSEFDLPSFSVKQLFNKFLLLMVRVIELVMPSRSHDARPSALLLMDPPPLDGKSMVIAYHQLKLDPSLL